MNLILKTCINCRNLKEDGRCKYGSLPIAYYCECFEPRRDLL